MTPRPDVAVIGAGAFGGWTAFYLQQRGARVALLDAWGAGNPRGTSSGETRIIRATYGEKAIYSEWAMRARSLWLEWEREWGVPMLVPCGVLWFWTGQPEYFRHSIAALERLHVPYERLGPDELARRYPQMSNAGIESAILETHSGILRAQRATQAVAEEVARRGGDVRIGVARPPEGAGARLVRLRLEDGGDLEAGAFVFACGPWLPQIFPEVLGKRIVVTKQDIFYFGSPAGDARFDAAHFPAWADYDTEFYGTPACDVCGFKVASNLSRGFFDPTRGERIVDNESLAAARGYLARRFPAMADAPVVRTGVCQYERSPDSHLVMDRHPNYQNVWMVGGGSGHGFKLGPALGEFLSRVVLENDRESIPAELRLGAVAFTETTAFPDKAVF